MDLHSIIVNIVTAMANFGTFTIINSSKVATDRVSGNFTISDFASSKIVESRIVVRLNTNSIITIAITATTAASKTTTV